MSKKVQNRKTSDNLDKAVKRVRLYGIVILIFGFLCLLALPFALAVGQLGICEGGFFGTPLTCVGTQTTWLALWSIIVFTLPIILLVIGGKSISKTISPFVLAVFSLILITMFALIEIDLVYKTILSPNPSGIIAIAIWGSLMILPLFYVFKWRRDYEMWYEHLKRNTRGKINEKKK